MNSLFLSLESDIGKKIVYKLLPQKNAFQNISLGSEFGKKIVYKLLPQKINFRT